MLIVATLGKYKTFNDCVFYEENSLANITTETNDVLEMRSFQIGRLIRIESDFISKLGKF